MPKRWRAARDTLTILSVAYPLLPVGPGSGGGAEQILHLVEKGLAGAGFCSIVVAATGSQVAGELIETPAAGAEISDIDREEAQHRHLEAIKSVMRRYTIDLIHFHGLDFLSYRPRHADVSQLATLHLPIEWYPPELFAERNLAFNFVSHSQAQSDPGAHSCAIVPNGIQLDAFSPTEAKEDYLLWVGRVCPEKGADIALRVAHRLDLPLVLAGPVHPFTAHRKYFAEQLTPLLDEKRRYIGPVEGKVKAQLFARARCLLLPSLACETSSLVAMEAISSGTPVIAYRSGALPEVIEDGKTGFLVDSEEAMASAVARVASISAAVCVHTAANRFSADRMVADYIRLYRQLLAAPPGHG